LKLLQSCFYLRGETNLIQPGRMKPNSQLVAN
jgi:hypothetical protein